MFNFSYAHDSDESRAILDHVKKSGVVPEYAYLGRWKSSSVRGVHVIGVEDPAVQDAIIAAAAEARVLYSTKPVKVGFSRGRVVLHTDGAVRYPDGLVEIRLAEIP